MAKKKFFVLLPCLIFSKILFFIAKKDKGGPKRKTPLPPPSNANANTFDPTFNGSFNPTPVANSTIMSHNNNNNNNGESSMSEQNFFNNDHNFNQNHKYNAAQHQHQPQNSN
jgi:hypothetical protein